MISKIIKYRGLFSSDALAMYLAYRNPNTPTAAKVIAIVNLLYIFFPIDFIPDIIPILGWLDDLGITMALTSWAASMIPADVMEKARAEAVIKAAKIKRILFVIAMVFLAFALWMMFMLWQVLSWLIDKL